jgi:ribosomal RNA-processing protein 12
MQDLLLLLLPYLTTADSAALFEFCLAAQVLGNNVNGVQKRGYKILAKLVESNKVILEAVTVIEKLDALADALVPAAKKVTRRFLSPLDYGSDAVGRIDSILSIYWSRSFLEPPCISFQQ